MANRSRRTFLAATAALPLLVRMRPANAVPAIEVLQPLVQKITGGAQLRDGRVQLDIPPLSDNGNSVPLKISVTSEMSERRASAVTHRLRNLA